MRTIIKFSIRHGVSVIALLSMILVFNLYGLFNLPLTAEPKVAYPEIKVSYFYPPADPDVIAESFINLIEGALWSIGGVEHSYSSISERNLSITLKLNPASNSDKFILRAYDRLKNLDLPSYFKGPVISKTFVHKEPDLELYIRNLNKKEISELTRRIRAIEGVEKVEVRGKTKSVIRMEPEIYKFIDLQIQPLNLVRRIAQNIEGLRIELNGKELEIEGEKGVFIQKYKGIAPKRLFKKYRVYQKMLIDGKEGVVIKLFYSENSNKLIIARRVKHLLEDLDLYRNIVITEDVEKTIKLQYFKVSLSFLIGISSLFLILVLVEGSIYSAFFILFTSLLSILSSLALFFLLHIPLNVITLAGLTFGLGLLVDTSIVFLEEYQEQREKYNTLRALLKAGSSVLSPLWLSTFTTLIGFFPFLYSSYEAKIRYSYFVLALSISLVMSIFLTYFISPLYFLKFSAPRHRKRFKWIGRFYLKTGLFLHRYRFIPLIIYLAGIFSIPVVFKRLKKEDIFLYKAPPAKDIMVYVSPVSGIIEAETFYNQLVIPVSKILEDLQKRYPKEFHYLIDFNEQFLTIYVKFPKGIDEEIPVNVRRALEDFFVNFNNLLITLSGGGISEDFYVSPSGYKILPDFIAICGYNYKVLKQIGQRIAEELRNSDRITFAISDYHLGYTPLSFCIDIKKWDRSYYETLRRFIIYRKLWDKNHELEIMPGIVDVYTANLRGMRVNKRHVSYRITRTDRYFQLLIGFGWIGDREELRTFLRTFKKTHRLPEGFYYTKFGKFQEEKEGPTKEFSITALLSVLFIILLIIALFNSFRWSFPVIAVLPFATSGIFISYFLSGTVFDGNSVMAAMVVLGIAVNDAIFFVKKFYKEKDLKKTMAARGKSILYTSITTITTALPFIFLYPPDAMWYKFAFAILGGIGFSTLYALFLLSGFLKG